MSLPCLTVGEVMDKLATMPRNAPMFAWAPGSYMPVASVLHYQPKDGGVRVLLEINVPDDAALAQR